MASMNVSSCSSVRICFGLKVNFGVSKSSVEFRGISPACFAVSSASWNMEIPRMVLLASPFPVIWLPWLAKASYNFWISFPVTWPMGLPPKLGLM